jgi:L-iditol 2-dehydrogenase
MGRMHVDLALSCRPAAVIVADLLAERLEIVRRLFTAKAERLGTALHTFHSAQADLGAYIQRVSEQRGADDVIVAVGAGQAIEAAQHYTARGGVLNLFGGLKQGEHLIHLATDIVHYREINVTGSSGGSPWDMAHTLELIAQGEVEPGKHITRIGDLDQAVELLQLVKAQQIDGKAIVYPHRRCARPRVVPAWSAQDEQEYLRG